MFIIKNLRKESSNGWTYLKCDFKVSEINNPFEEKDIWIAVEDKNADMLTDEVYDPFVLVPLILGMKYNQNVRIEGDISPRFYHNITHYLMTIFDNFSDFTSKIEFTVSGLKKLDYPIGNMIGTGISCGVDNMVTLYDNFAIENDPDFKVNSLFFVNCGTHGDYENPKSKQLWIDRSKLNKMAADAMGLPMYLIDSNFHAFTHKWREQTIGYLAIYSCVLSMQKMVKRYLTSSNLCYDEIADCRKLSRDFDIAEYCEDYMPHLISTERFELVIDGCQYTRAEKTERISEWSIAQQYLNVCVSPNEEDHGNNCSCCHKCMWTLIPLDAMGKLNNFKNVFDIEIYHKYKGRYIRKFVSDYGKDSMETSIINYCKKKDYKLPTYVYSNIRKRIEWKLGMGTK